MADFEDLSGPIEDELARARARELRAGSVDPQDLEKDLARVEFNPDYATDLPDTTVIFDGQPVPIHQVRNFPIIFKIVDYWIRRKIKPGMTKVERAVLESMHTSRYDDVLAELKMEYPALYLRMREIADNFEKQTSNAGLYVKGQVVEATEEEKAEWAYISSTAYGAAAEIARSIDSNYDLSQLYFSPVK